MSAERVCEGCNADITFDGSEWVAWSQNIRRYTVKCRKTASGNHWPAWNVWRVTDERGSVTVTATSRTDALNKAGTVLL